MTPSLRMALELNCRKVLVRVEGRRRAVARGREVEVEVKLRVRWGSIVGSLIDAVLDLVGLAALETSVGLVRLNEGRDELG